jgi:hypothetical protein
VRFDPTEIGCWLREHTAIRRRPLPTVSEEDTIQANPMDYADLATVAQLAEQRFCNRPASCATAWKRGSETRIFPPIFPPIFALLSAYIDVRRGGGGRGAPGRRHTHGRYAAFQSRLPNQLDRCLAEA